MGLSCDMNWLQKICTAMECHSRAGPLSWFASCGANSSKYLHIEPIFYSYFRKVQIILKILPDTARQP